MKPDLIEQLSKLNPTEGEWFDCYGLIDTGEVQLFDRIEATTDDCTLVALAPTMRLEILAMAKEIDDMKEINRILRLRIEDAETKAPDSFD